MSSRCEFLLCTHIKWKLDYCTRHALYCEVLYAHPRYGVEGLWENIVAWLVSSPSFLKFLFIRNMNDFVRSDKKIWQYCVKDCAPGCGSGEVWPSLQLDSEPVTPLRLHEKSTLRAEGGNTEQRKDNVDLKEATFRPYILWIMNYGQWLRMLNGSSTDQTRGLFLFFYLLRSSVVSEDEMMCDCADMFVCKRQKSSFASLRTGELPTTNSYPNPKRNPTPT